MNRHQKRKQSSSPAAAVPSSPLWNRAPIIAAVVAFLVYLPSLAGGFLYDDIRVIVENRQIRDLRALTTVLSYEPSRPLLNLTWGLNYAMNGLTPWPYYLVNVLIHAANAALIASLFSWIAVRLSIRREAALFGACLFAVSPMAVETVAYVSSRSTALASLFGLASLYFASRFLTQKFRLDLVWSFVFFILALATKEEAIILPLLFVLLDFFFVAEQKISKIRHRLRIHLAFFAVPFLGILARRMVTGTWLPPAVMDRGLYLLTQWTVFPQYLIRTMIPLDPAFYRNHPPVSWPPDGIALICGLITVIVSL